MFGEMSLWAWMGISLVFLLGGAAGYVTARNIKDQRTRELEEKLEQTKTELADYRGEVDRHFLKTSLLFSKLTDDYREVYEHLANGAQTLCKDKPAISRLNLPEQQILTAAGTAALGSAMPASEPQAQPRSDDPGLEQAEASAREAAQAEEDITAETEMAAPPPQDTHVDEEALAETVEESPVKAKANIEDETATGPNGETPPPASEVASAEEDVAENEDIHLGAESATGVDFHKTHGSVH